MEGTLTLSNDPINDCSDNHGNVWFTEVVSHDHSYLSGQIVKYKHGGVKPIETLSDQNVSTGCAVDPSSAGARLLLAVAEWLVHEAGGEVAYCDADSLVIVATEQGGFVPCEFGPYVMADGGRAVRALSWMQVDRPVHVTSVGHMGKEVSVDPTDAPENVTAEQLSATHPVHYRDACAKYDALRARIRAAGISIVAREARVSRSAVDAFVN